MLLSEVEHDKGHGDPREMSSLKWKDEEEVHDSAWVEVAPRHRQSAEWKKQSRRSDGRSCDKEPDPQPDGGDGGDGEEELYEVSRRPRPLQTATHNPQPVADKQKEEWIGSRA